MGRSMSRKNLARAVKTMERARRGRLQGVERAIKELKPGEEAEVKDALIDQ